ncbi:MAG TPA: fibronectin type III domain-containing protein [Chloroflexota bacterium]|nr:fibronectin type III domain-containing protein [Chloroflexota bacterium]
MAAAPVIQAVSVSSLTRSSVTFTWTTDLPATSQVEYGTMPINITQSVPDGSLVTAHRYVLTGLQAGTQYRYRVLSTTATGGLGSSIEALFVTTPAGSGPEVANLSVRRVTGTTAAIGWSTSSGTVAQLEYGLTANYGFSTLLRVYASPAQEMVLMGLRPGSEYHYRIKAWDAVGFLGASDDGLFMTAFNGQATLLGSETIQPEQVSLAPGQAAAYQYVAGQSGQASLMRLFVDGGTTATVIRVGLYADLNGVPGAILSQGSGPGLVAGWSSVTLPPVSLVQGTHYWIVVLSPLGGGTLNLRDAGRGGSSVLSRQTALAALPAVYSAGALTARSPLSVYVQQVPPAVTLMGPVDGAVLTGKAELSAVVDDDAPVTRVQFLVDGLPVGLPLVTAPFTVLWDTTAVRATQPHFITVRVTDLQGRTALSGMVTVAVDNGPTISDVVVSRGLTLSSVSMTWATDLAADGQVEFGPTTLYGSTTPLDARAAWIHQAQLTALVPGTTYHYRVKSRDANGALAVSPDGVFFTPEP